MEREILVKLIDDNLSQYQIAEKLNCSQSNVRYWLRKFKIKTNHLAFDTKDYGENRCCSKCNTPKPISDFYERRNKKGGSAYCKECTKQQSLKRHREFKEVVVKYKGGSCENCGYNKFISALEFHHIDPSEKDFSISNVKTYKLTDKIKNELDKCILVCSNCHREIHEKLNNAPMT